MTFKKSNEAFWWSLFSAGGVASALFMPALVIAVGVVLPNQYLDDPRASYEHLFGLVAWWPARLLLLGDPERLEAPLDATRHLGVALHVDAHGLVVGHPLAGVVGEVAPVEPLQERDQLVAPGLHPGRHTQRCPRTSEVSTSSATVEGRHPGQP